LARKRVRQLDQNSPGASRLSRPTARRLKTRVAIAAVAWWVVRSQIAPLQQLRDHILGNDDDAAQATIPLHSHKDEVSGLAQTFEHLIRQRLAAEAKTLLTEAELRAATDSSLDAFCIF
jgi:HAMP domain-containing protein